MVDLEEIKKELAKPLLQCIAQVADDTGVRIFCIGGHVRDLILQRPSKDLDLVVEGDGIAIANAVAERMGGLKVSVFKRFGTAMFMYQGEQVEFVGARKESYSKDSRKPSVSPGSIQDDQNRRDFTINALAISLNKADRGTLIDPFDGLNDLLYGVLRTPLDPDITYSDDPLRMMRAVRFAAQLGFSIEENSLAAINRNAHRMEIVSMERTIDELNKIILCKVPSNGLSLLFNTGLLEVVFPELHALHGVEKRNGITHKDNFWHTLQVLDNLSQHTEDLWLRWAALLHDIAKPATKRFDPRAGWTFHGHEDRGARMVPNIFRRLKLPLDSKMKYVQKLVLLHLRPIALTNKTATDSAVRRLLFEAGDDIDDLMLLCQADITSKNDAKVKRILQNYEMVKRKLQEVEEKDRIRNWQPPVSGNEIMDAFKIQPCKTVGDIRNAIKEAILDGEIPNEKDAAMAYMRKKGEELGLVWGGS